MSRFTKGVLPGRTRGNGLFLQAQAEGPRLEFTAVNAVSIAQQVAGWVGVGNSLGELLSRLGDRRRIRYIEVQDLSAPMRQHQEDIEDSKREVNEKGRILSPGEPNDLGFGVWSITGTDRA